MDGRPLAEEKNTDLVKMGPDLYHRLTPRLQWVRGHNGNAGNERADKLAGLAAVNRQPSSCWYEPSISLRNEEQRELVLAAPEADVEGKLTEDDIRWEKAELVRLEKRLLEDCSAVGSSVKAAYVIAETGAFWTSIHRELSEKARMKHGWKPLPFAAKPKSLRPTCDFHPATVPQPQLEI